MIVSQGKEDRNISKLNSVLLAFTSNDAFFLKKKRGLKLASLPHFLHRFYFCFYFEKYCSCYILLIHVLVAFTSWDIG